MRLRTVIEKPLFASRFVAKHCVDLEPNNTEKDSVSLLWRIGAILIAGWSAFALGLNVSVSIIACLVAFGIMIRREIFDSLFPLQAYRKNSLSVRGLEHNPEFEEQFRRDLASSICGAFPGSKPTACCCISKSEEICVATLILHSSQGHLQIQVRGDSFFTATKELLEKVLEYKGNPGSRLSTENLLPRCRGCATRKAHRLINRNYPDLNPLSKPAGWGYFLSRLRALFY